jgi:hypothetical protein
MRNRHYSVLAYNIRSSVLGGIYYIRTSPRINNCLPKIPYLLPYFTHLPTPYQASNLSTGDPIIPLSYVSKCKTVKLPSGS